MGLRFGVTKNHHIFQKCNKTENSGMFLASFFKKANFFSLCRIRCPSLSCSSSHPSSSTLYVENLWYTSAVTRGKTFPWFSESCLWGLVLQSFQSLRHKFDSFCAQGSWPRWPWTWTCLSHPSPRMSFRFYSKSLRSFRAGVKGGPFSSSILTMAGTKLRCPWIMASATGNLELSTSPGLPWCRI